MTDTHDHPIQWPESPLTWLRDQPPPRPNDEPPVVPQVIADLTERMALGIQRYGVPLQPNNYRDMLRDAYEECLDLAVYLKGCMLEREAPRRQNPWAPHNDYASALMAGIRDGTIVDPDLWLNPQTGEVETRPVRLSKDELDGEREYRARLIQGRVAARQIEQERARRERLLATAEPVPNGLGE